MNCNRSTGATSDAAKGAAQCCRLLASGVEATYPSRSALLFCRCTCTCGSPWVTSSRKDLVLPFWNIPDISFLYDDVDPHIPVRWESFPDFNLVMDRKSTQSAGNRVEKSLVLVNLCPSSGAEVCVSGVHVDCIAAGRPHCHVLLISMKRLPIPTTFDAGMTRS